MTLQTPVTEEPLVADEATATSWAEAKARLQTPEQDRTFWLATVRPDGRPHVVPLLGLWLDDAFYFLTGEATLRQVADAYQSSMGWPLEVRDGTVYGPSAPTAGPPPYAVMKLTPNTALGLPGIAGTEAGVGKAGSFTPTRWRF